MSDKQTEIRKIWNERFNDSRQWMTEVFSRIYNDSDAMTLEVNGEMVSSLLLRHYTLRFRSEDLPASYIYGAATRRARQGHGYMSRLMVEALQASRDRGDVIAMLRPARRSLYGFYDMFGFATVFYIDERRYTSAHTFDDGADDFTVDETVCDIEELTRAYRRLTSSRESTIVHTEQEFKNILIDNAVDRGLKAIVRRIDTGEIAAVAFAGMRDHAMVVHEIVSADDRAGEVALSSLKKRAGNVMTVVIAPPRREGVNIYARAMARIVNVEKLLQAMAVIDPKLHQRIRVHDPLIPENDRLFIVENGDVRIVDPDGRHVDLDVTVEVLTSIVFSETEMGEIFDLPTARPFMALMLD